LFVGFMKDVLENCRLKSFFECDTSGVVRGRGMCPTRERSEIRKGVGKEAKSEKKKTLEKTA